MITAETVQQVAKLARLELEASEAHKLTEQLGSILDYVAQLNEMDTTGIPPTAHPLPIDNVTRPDALRPSLSIEQVLQNAPVQEQDMFRVPKILSE